MVRRVLLRKISRIVPSWNGARVKTQRMKRGRPRGWGPGLVGRCMRRVPWMKASVPVSTVEVASSSNTTWHGARGLSNPEGRARHQEDLGPWHPGASLGRCRAVAAAPPRGFSPRHGAPSQGLRGKPPGGDPRHRATGVGTCGFDRRTGTGWGLHRVVEARRPKRLPELGVRNLVAWRGEVGAHGATEEDGVLGNDAKGGPELL